VHDLIPVQFRCFTGPIRSGTRPACRATRAGIPADGAAAAVRGVVPPCYPRLTAYAGYISAQRATQQPTVRTSVWDTSLFRDEAHRPRGRGTRI